MPKYNLPSPYVMYDPNLDMNINDTKSGDPLLCWVCKYHGP